MYTMWQLIETQSTWLQNHCIARLERSITSPSMAGGGGWGGEQRDEPGAGLRGLGFKGLGLRRAP